MPTATAADPIGSAPAETGRSAQLVAAARRPVAADSVAVARIAFGLLVAYSSLRFLAKEWVDTLYLAPEHHLTYPSFDWVRPWPAPFMHLHVAALALLGVGIALGYRHRLCAALFVVGFAYVELIDAGLYLNHYWYVTLAGALLVVLPVHHRWSLDARSGRVRPSTTVPVVVVWALRAQLGVVYVFAGLAKVNADWLLEALPLRLWLADHTDLPIVGPLLAVPVTAFVAAWAGAFFDLTIVGWLSWRRSRPFAYAAVVVFHLATAALFPIGVFPWVMILSTPVFFDPDWPSRMLTRLGIRVGGGSAMGDPEPPRIGRAVLVGLAVLAVVEVALPLRHHLHDGDVRWNEAGYYLSWRVMLTEKAGYLDFEVTDPATGDRWLVGPEVVLADWQITQAAIRPDLLHTAAHLVAEHYAERGHPGVEVRAVDAWVSMNGRAPHRLVDPEVDLAAIPRSWATPSWVLPAPGG